MPLFFSRKYQILDLTTPDIFAVSLIGLVLIFQHDDACFTGSHRSLDFILTVNSNRFMQKTHLIIFEPFVSSFVSEIMKEEQTPGRGAAEQPIIQIFLSSLKGASYIKSAVIPTPIPRVGWKNLKLKLKECTIRLFNLISNIDSQSNNNIPKMHWSGCVLIQ